MSNGTQTPKMSIIMPVFNGAKFLSDTLASIRTQTFTDFEVIIVDDGSIDETASIAEENCANDNRFRLISHGENKGVAAARWTGWHATNPGSKYLMNHDCDDISRPEKFARLVNYLDQHPEVDGVGCFAEYIDGTGKVTGAPPLEWRPNRIRATFARMNSMINSATLFRRAMIEMVDPYHSEFKLCEDYEFWAKALLAGFELANIPEMLHQVRLHPSSVSAVKAKEMEIYARQIGKFYRKARFLGRFTQSRKKA